MMGFLSKLRFLSATALSLVVVNGVGVNFRADLSGQGWQGGDRAEARSSGGRSRGGSFSRPSGGGLDSPSRSRPAPSYNDPSYNDPYYRQPRTAPVPVPVPYGGGYGGYGYSSGGGFWLILLFLLLGSGILPIVWSYLMQSARRSASGGSGYAGTGECDNDIVTVTQLQVALLAQARYIQEELTQLTLTVDPDTPAGLTQMLQETVLALLRSPENWTHVRASSQTVRSREEASRLFEQLSIEERSKFSAETLARVGGQVRRQAVRVPDEDPASYIVVTLLIGSADDRPLFKEKIYSAEELQQTLQRLGSLTPDYLLVFEVLWSPQDASDSLTRDELLTEYSDLIQIA